MARNRKAKSDAELVREIVDAWNNPGAHPPYHRQMQRMLRQSWPSLAEPVRELAGRAEFDSWLAKHEAEVAAKAVEAFAETLEVDVGYEDDEWWRGFRQGQRRALDSAVELAAEYRNAEE